MHSVLVFRDWIRVHSVLVFRDWIRVHSVLLIVKRPDALRAINSKETGCTPCYYR